jgi:hypothetical protein
VFSETWLKLEARSRREIDKIIKKAEDSYVHQFCYQIKSNPYVTLCVTFVQKSACRHRLLMHVYDSALFCLFHF